jgi:DNA-directed RNA polymerase subunit E'/Rpb7
MSSIREITRRVCVDASSLTSDIEKHIFYKLEIDTKKECTLEQGYLIRVVKIVNIKDSYISNANSDIIFEIDFQAETIKPEVGSLFDGVVWKIFEKGLFVIVQERLRILVALPALQDKGYELVSPPPPGSSFFALKKRDASASASASEIRVGSILNVVILGVKFNKGFTCYADLKV